ncbi:hypothetical protein D3C87_2006790 [compost metagenome]
MEFVRFGPGGQTAKQHHELVAAEPADDHPPIPDGVEPGGDTRDHLVANVVAKRVVDQLEPVYIENAEGNDPVRRKQSHHFLAEGLPP